MRKLQESHSIKIGGGEFVGFVLLVDGDLRFVNNKVPNECSTFFILL